MSGHDALSTGEVPDALIAARVAAAYALPDAIRSAYLDRCCRQDFSADRQFVTAQGLAKARATRARNAAKRAAMGQTGGVTP
jgi:hypothetical protein